MAEYMKTNRTPFELRTDLLKIAQDYLHKQYVANMEMYNSTLKVMQQGAVELQSDLRTEMPKYFDFQDILNKARELYGFISTK